MTPFPYSVDIGANIADAVSMMAEHEIRHVPITRDGDVVGMLSDRDIRSIAEEHYESLSVEEITMSPPYVVDLETDLKVVLRTMVERHIGSAVVTRKGKLAGIFTAIDACRAFADHLQTQFPPAPPDVVA